MNNNEPEQLPVSVDPQLFVFFNEIGIIEQLSRSAFERVLPRGMTLPQFAVLNHFVRLGGPKTPAQLASAFQVSRATMTNTLKRLDEAGLIQSLRDPDDGRSKKIDITPAGRDMREFAIAAIMPTLTSLSQRIDVRGLMEILPTLQAVRAGLDENRDLDVEPAKQAED